jgi:hypothetical protein
MHVVYVYAQGNIGSSPIRNKPYWSHELLATHRAEDFKAVVYVVSHELLHARLAKRVTTICSHRLVGYFAAYWAHVLRRGARKHVLCRRTHTTCTVTDIIRFSNKPNRITNTPQDSAQECRTGFGFERKGSSGRRRGVSIECSQIGRSCSSCTSLRPAGS